MSTVDRSQWWVALDGEDDACVWAPDQAHPYRGPYVVARQRLVSIAAWTVLTDGLPDRGDCEDCTAVPCPAHDPAGVAIPQEDQP